MKSMYEWLFDRDVMSWHWVDAENRVLKIIYMDQTSITIAPAEGGWEPVKSISVERKTNYA